LHDNCKMTLEEEIQQTKFTSHKQKAVLNVIFTAGWARSMQSRVFKCYGISGEQFNVLRILRGQKGNTIGVNGIQERMLDKNSNASRLIDKLKDKNLVERIACANDRRQVEIFITEQGLALLKELDGVIKKMENESVNLTESESEQLSQLLDKLRSNNNNIITTQ
jgi:DNA-binding MarR family transcriptional regulator